MLLQQWSQTDYEQLISENFVYLPSIRIFTYTFNQFLLKIEFVYKNINF